MKKIFENQFIIFILRIFLGFIFIYASCDKILHPAQFAQKVSNYKIIPLFLNNIFAIILPWIELIAGLFLVLGFCIKGSALVITSLLFLFILAALLGVIRNLDIECGCFNTALGRKIGLRMIIEDSILLMMSLWIMLKGKGLKFRDKINVNR